VHPVDRRAAALKSPHRTDAVYHLLSQAFIEMDAGDKRFLAALSPVTRNGRDGASSDEAGDNEDYVLTIPHFWALVHLEPDDGRTMAELAHLLICDKSNVTKIVDKLEDLGWARRMPGKGGDRRFMRVVLTTEGRTVREHVIAAHAEWVHRRFAPLTLAQLDQLESLLRLALDGFRLDPEAAARELTLDSSATPSASPSKRGSGDKPGQFGG
jgi:DNA-binding MarR family transcriptional regulator